MSRTDISREEQKSKKEETLEFIKETGKTVIITALTTAVSIGVSMLMNKDSK